MASLKWKKTNKDKKQSVEVLKNQKSDLQLSFFQLDDPTLSQIKDELIHIDINSLTPIEALMKLNEIKSLIDGWFFFDRIEKMILLLDDKRE